MTSAVAIAIAARNHVMKTNNENKEKYLNVSNPAINSKASPTFNIKELFRDNREVRLQHGDDEYRLRLTKNNKLILTK